MGPYEQRFVIISLSNRHFKEYPPPTNSTVLHTAIKHPCSLNLLTDHNNITKCEVISTDSGDGNVNGRLFIGSFQLETVSNSLIIRTKNDIIGMFQKDKGKLNALSNFAFNRASEGKSNGISVCIKVVQGYTPFMLDIIDYYKTLS